MRAAQINSYGAKDVLQAVADAPKPTLGEEQVLVEVYATAVNPFDITMREGRMRDHIPLQFPATLGGDLAGVVAELGAGVVGFEVGDEVYGQANAASGVGSYAEFAPVKQQSLAPKPRSTDFVTAAALPLAGCSAYQALVDHAGLQAGQKVLIHGGAGGIGSYAVQLAKHLGAHVATTVSADDVDYVKLLGADEVIDYKSQDFIAQISDYDVIFSTVGSEPTDKSYQVLKRGGILVSMTASVDEDQMKQYGVTALHQNSKVTRERLEKLAELVDSGAIKVNVDKVFPLEKASEALAYVQEDKHRGKVVIRVKD